MWHHLIVFALTCDTIKEFYNDQQCCDADAQDLVQTCFAYVPSLLALNRFNSLPSQADLLFSTLPTTNQAYQIQIEQSQRFFRSMQWSVNAYKAGVTTQAGGALLNTTQPLYAAYAHEQALENNASIMLASCQGFASIACGLELEFGYALNISDVPSQFTEDNVLQYIVSVSPVFEIVQFLSGTRFTALDLILTNVASWRYVRGTAVNWTPSLQNEIDAFAANITTSDTNVAQGKSSNLNILSPASPLTILVATLNHILQVDPTSMQQDMFILTGNMLSTELFIIEDSIPDSLHRSFIEMIISPRGSYACNFTSVGMGELKVNIL